MSVKDLIARWEEALAEAQLDARIDELREEDLEVAALPGVAARFGLRAGDQTNAVLSVCTGCDNCHSWLVVDGHCA